MNYYCNMCRYDSKGRRVAIFAEKHGNYLEIAIFPCSKKDMFSRKKAHTAYKALCESVEQCNSLGFHPMLDMIEMKDSSKPKKEFLDWVNRNYYRIFTQIERVHRNIIDIKRVNKKHPFIEIKYLHK